MKVGNQSEWKRHAWVVLFLAFFCSAYYARTVRFPFLAYDDNHYVTENPVVLSGISVDGLVWAFTTGYYANWHPLTWISLQLDATLGNGSPVAFRISQIFLHACTVGVVYLIFVRLGCSNIAFFASVLYGIHPLHVESVTWISERKGILSTFFIAIATLIYLEHQKRPAKATFIAFCAAYACSLMSKQMGVMLPFVLPLLHLASAKLLSPVEYLRQNNESDIRFGLRGLRLILASVVRLVTLIINVVSANRWLYLVSFTLAVLSTFIAFVVQDATGALQDLKSVSYVKRFEIISDGYLAYLFKYLYPINLSFHYHNYRENVSIGALIIKSCGLCFLVISAFCTAREFPRYSAAMIWYFVSIFPVIGIVSIGDHIMADRYSDWPLLLIHYWFAAVLVSASTYIFEKRVLTYGQFAIPVRYLPVTFLLIVIGIVSHRQIGFRRDSTSVFDRALQIDPRNPRAHQLKGFIALNEGRFVVSRFHTELAIQWMPWNSHAHNNLGLIELEEGDLEAAEASFRRALRELGTLTDAESNLAMALMRRGKLEEALRILKSLVQRVPDDVAVNMNLASVYRRMGDDHRSLAQYARTIRLSPHNAPAWHYYGVVAENLGQLDQAANAYLQAWQVSGKTLLEAAEALNRINAAKLASPISSMVTPTEVGD